MGKSRDQWEGIDTSGLSEETFGVSGKSNREKFLDFSDTSNEDSTYVFLNGENDSQAVGMDKGQSEAFATIAMIIGIVSLFLCGCNMFFGIIGIVIGVVALKKCGKTTKVKIGLTCSIISVVVALITSVMFAVLSRQEELFWEDEVVSEELNSVEGDADYQESQVKSNEGSQVISDEEASRLMVNGYTFEIPCQLERLLEKYEISEHDQFLMEEGLEAYSSNVVYLARNGVECGISAVIYNPTDEAILDICKAEVTSIEVDGYAGIQATTVNGVSIGMTEQEVDTLVKDMKYNKSKMENYIFYNIYPNDEENYYITLMLTEEVVTNIGVYYSGE